MIDLGNKWLNLTLWTVIIFLVITLMLGIFAVSPPVGLLGGLAASVGFAYLLMKRRG